MYCTVWYRIVVPNGFDIIPTLFNHIVLMGLKKKPTMNLTRTKTAIDTR